MTTEIAAPDRRQNAAGKYLTFALQRESYGIDVLKVREIIRLTNITAVPRMPEYVKGVINLRGKIIPVMDLRLRFGFSGTKDTDLTCIIVVQVKLPGGANLAATDIEETPDFGSTIQTDYILGMAKVKGTVKTLLDIDRVIGAETAAQIKAVVA